MENYDSRTYAFHKGWGMSRLKKNRIAFDLKLLSLFENGMKTPAQKQFCFLKVIRLNVAHGYFCCAFDLNNLFLLNYCCSSCCAFIHFCFTPLVWAIFFWCWNKNEEPLYKLHSNMDSFLAVIVLNSSQQYYMYVLFIFFVNFSTHAFKPWLLHTDFIIFFSLFDFIIFSPAFRFHLLFDFSFKVLKLNWLFFLFDVRNGNINSFWSRFTHSDQMLNNFLDCLRLNARVSVWTEYDKRLKNNKSNRYRHCIKQYIP